MNITCGFYKDIVILPTFLYSTRNSLFKMWKPQFCHLIRTLLDIKMMIYDDGHSVIFKAYARSTNYSNQSDLY